MEDWKDDTEDEEELRGSLLGEAFSWEVLRKLCGEAGFRAGVESTARAAEKAVQAFLQPYHAEPDKALDTLFQDYSFEEDSSDDEESLGSDSEEINESSDDEVDIDEILQKILYNVKERSGRDIKLVDDPIVEVPEVKCPSPKVFEVRSPSPKVFEVRSPSPNVLEVRSPSPNVLEVRSPSPKVFEVRSPSPNVLEVKSPLPNVLTIDETKLVVRGEVTSPEVPFLKNCYVELKRLNFEPIENTIERVEEIASPDLPPPNLLFGKCPDEPPPNFVFGKCPDEPPPNFVFGGCPDDPLPDLVFGKCDVDLRLGVVLPTTEKEEQPFTRRSRVTESTESRHPRSRESSTSSKRSNERRSRDTSWDRARRDIEHHKRKDDFPHESSTEEQGYKRREWPAQRWNERRPSRGFNRESWSENRYHPVRSNQQSWARGGDSRGSWTREDNTRTDRHWNENNKDKWKGWFRDEITGEWIQSGTHGPSRDLSLEEWFKPKGKVFNSKFEEEMDECWNGPHFRGGGNTRGSRPHFYPKPFNSDQKYFQKRSNNF